MPLTLNANLNKQLIRSSPQYAVLTLESPNIAQHQKESTSTKMEMSFALEELFGGGSGGGGGRGQIGVHRYMQENLIYFSLLSDNNCVLSNTIKCSGQVYKGLDGFHIMYKLYGRTLNGFHRCCMMLINCIEC